MRVNRIEIRIAVFQVKPNYWIIRLSGPQALDPLRTFYVHIRTYTQYEQSYTESGPIHYYEYSTKNSLKLYYDR